MIAACIGVSVKGIHAQREFCYEAARGNWVYFYLALMRVPPPPQMSTFAQPIYKLYQNHIEYIIMIKSPSCNLKIPSD